MPLRVALAQEGPAPGVLVFASPPNFAQFWIRGISKQVVWVDAMNFGQGSLPGESQGMPQVAALAEWWQRWAGLCDRLKLGGAKYTVASQSQGGWRRSYLTCPVLCHVRPDALWLEEESYHGGRCEAFRIGVVPEPVWDLDATGFYGRLAREPALPCELHTVVPGMRPQEATQTLREKEVIARVLISTDEPAYPLRVRVVPDPDGVSVRPAVCGKPSGQEEITIYPIGRFWTTLSAPELRDALRSSRVLAVGSTAIYGRGPALAAYSEAVEREKQKAREAGDKATVALCKLLHNTLPGRLGQRRAFWEPDPEGEATQPYGVWTDEDAPGGPRRYRTVAWNVEREVIDGFAADAVPAIASWITSMGRVTLLNWIRRAGWRNCYYCDTDGGLFNGEGYQRLGVSGQDHNMPAGGLRRVAGPSSAEIRGVKWLTVGTRTVAAGLPGSAPGDGDRLGAANGPVWIGRPILQGRRPEAERELRPFGPCGAYRHGRVLPGGLVLPWAVDWPHQESYGW